MKLLILGGTRFLGRALVESALAAGDEVTLFNRGQSGPELFSQVEQLRGDRDSELGALHGRSWDAVIDTCGYVPRLVGDSARLLAGAIETYTFISSISVYADPVAAGSDEGAALATMTDEHTEEITGETYGPLKVLCERKATAEMDGRALLVRPGLIVGPHDPTDRFTYWPGRAGAGGEILAPGLPTRLVQFIDVRDVADWTLAATRAHRRGPFNVTGPAAPLTMGEMLAACQENSGFASSLTWVTEEFLLAQDVTPWSDLPLWVPAADNGFLEVDISKALAAGLTLRPLAATVRDTLAWSATLPSDHAWRAGLPPEREAELLAAWQARA